MGNVTVVCFLASYVVAFALELVRLFRRAPGPAPGWSRRAIMLLFAAAGLVAHTMYLVIRSRQVDLPPLLASTSDWMLVLAWLAILFYLLLTLLDRDLAVGLFLLPLVLALIVAAYFVSDQPNSLLVDPRNRDAIRPWGMLHASLLVFGIAGVVLAFMLSLMYLVQHRRLKHQQTLIGGLTLPSLERLARLNWWAVIVSVPLLTLGMATGIGLAVYQRRQDVPISFTDPVILLDGVAWLAMAAFFVWLLRTDRPAGKQVAWLTLWACGFLLVTLFGLQVFAGGGLSLVPTWHS